jgi:hypothetical protein
MGTMLFSIRQESTFLSGEEAGWDHYTPELNPFVQFVLEMDTYTPRSKLLTYRATSLMIKRLPPKTAMGP